MDIYTSQQLHQLDAYTIERQGILSVELMERAAAAFAKTFSERFPKERPVVVFAGAGNNGGDALCVSRLLLQQGYSLDVYLLNPGGSLSRDCEEERERLVAAKTERLAFHEVSKQLNVPHLTEQTVVIDGLFGTGINRPLGGGLAAVVRYINSSPAEVVAIDVPSGLMTEDNEGNALSHVMHAALTLTFHAPKLAFLFAENEPFVGEWQVLDIGLERPEGLKSPWHMSAAADIRPLLKKPSRFAHKGTQGHALLVAGREGVGGCSVLAARACLRSGVGKLTVQTAEANRLVLQTAVPEAIVACGGRDLPSIEEVDAVGIGPGMGTDAWAYQQLQNLLRGASGPMVVDADALTLLAKHPQLLSALPPDTILTPHHAELERLVGKQPSTYQLLQQAVRLARLHRLNILVKGAWSACVSATGDIYFNPTGNPGMATAGSGDVLTGMILAMLAQGTPPLAALRLSVYLHGLSADIAVAHGHPAALVASDIVSHLPQAFHALCSN